MIYSGTPLQNNLTELWSLLNFLMGEIFDDLRVFQSWFDAKEMDLNLAESDRIIKQEKQTNILQTLHRILTPFLLRRVKSDVDLKIPPKKEVIVYCPLTTKQRTLYKAIVDKTIGDLMDKGHKSKELNPDESGAGFRRKAAIDYSVFLKEEGSTQRELDNYIEKLTSIQDARADMRDELGQGVSKNVNKTRRDADVNIRVKSRMSDLRKVTNHPYLIEYPLVEDGDGAMCYR